MRIALKEWAVAIDAMARGEQIVLVRKGGIREEAREFRVEHTQFLLYPTYEHQRANLVQPAHQADLAATLAGWGGPATVTLRAWAEVIDSVAISDATTVARLAPYYVYTENYAEERLQWRPRKPLQVLLVRAYLLAEPVTLPVLPEYGGCRSWITLGQEVPLPVTRPALDETVFADRRAAVRAVLAEHVGAA